jgi:purine-nucleoside phosphorylase
MRADTRHGAETRTRRALASVLGRGPGEGSLSQSQPTPDRSAAAQNLASIRCRTDLAPRVGIVLGSGLGDLVDDVENRVEIPYGDLDGFPATGVSGHRGRLVLGQFGGTSVAMLAGRGHFYEHGRSDVMRPALETLQALGIDTLILTNAAGSLREDIPPGSVMLITDHINFANRNPLIDEPTDARFVGMTQAYDRELQEAARRAAAEEGIALAEGVYIWFSGPSFETPAEIRAARALGADAAGMSTVPEVILARFLGLRVLAFSVVTNFAAGMTGRELSHEETKEVAPQGGAKLRRLLFRLLSASRQAAQATPRPGS